MTNLSSLRRGSAGGAISCDRFMTMELRFYQLVETTKLFGTIRISKSTKLLVAQKSGPKCLQADTPYPRVDSIRSIYHFTMFTALCCLSGLINTSTHTKTVKAHTRTTRSTRNGSVKSWRKTGSHSFSPTATNRHSRLAGVIHLEKP